ncbi:MAG TPA: transglycosylase family protein [Acidimicrobiales bacterium]|nr:transglycosylase family protein [Acidimicrobiales bacterium]
MRKHPLLALCTTTVALTASGTIGHGAVAAASTRHVPHKTAPRRARRDGRAVLLDRVTATRTVPLGPIAPLARAVGLVRLAGRGIASAVHRTGTRGAIRSAYLPMQGVWLALRRCESGDNYGTDTGNGYYGAYQFALTTWWGIGFSGTPNAAPPAVQDSAARTLQQRVGWSAWPACSAMLGLR